MSRDRYGVMFQRAAKEAALASRSGMPSPRMAAPKSRLAEQQSFGDHRLRGLSANSLSGFRPEVSLSSLDRDMGKLRHDVMHPDPYNEQARSEREIGHRMPLPYSSPTAMAGTLPMPASNYESQYENLHSSRASVMAPSVSGRRETMSGTYGAITPQANPWSARDRFGFGRMGSRGGGGYSEEWDARPTMQRRSGKWTTTSKAAQTVDPRWPFLHLVAKGDTTNGGNAYDGNALIRVQAGLHDTGGAQATREFWLGGGFTAQFDLNGWDQATIEVLDILVGTNVQFAWVTSGMQGGPRNLYLPQRVSTGGAAVPVPEGADSLIIEDPALGIAGTTFRLAWITQGASFPGDVVMTVDVDDGFSGSNNQYGQELQVLGTAVDFVGLAGGGPDFDVDIVWVMRSI
jgi:hypothetical protein